MLYVLDFFLPDAFRTVEHSPHKLSGACLQVSFFEELEEEKTESFKKSTEEKFGEGITIIISDILPSITEEFVSNYFENARRSGGGEVHKIEYHDDKGEAVITFLEVKGMLAKLIAFKTKILIRTNWQVVVK